MTERSEVASKIGSIGNHESMIQAHILQLFFCTKFPKKFGHLEIMVRVHILKLFLLQVTSKIGSIHM